MPKTIKIWHVFGISLTFLTVWGLSCGGWASERGEIRTARINDLREHLHEQNYQVINNDLLLHNLCYTDRTEREPISDARLTVIIPVYGSDYERPVIYHSLTRGWRNEECWSALRSGGQDLPLYWVYSR